MLFRDNTVPKMKSRVRLRLTAGETLSGFVHLLVGQRPIDMLVDQRPFFPFHDEAGALTVIAKEHVVHLTPLDIAKEEDDGWIRLPSMSKDGSIPKRRVAVRLRLATEEVYEGDAFLLANQRPVDMLCDSRAFFPLDTKESVLVLGKRHVVSLTPLEAPVAAKPSAHVTATA